MSQVPVVIALSFRLRLDTPNAPRRWCSQGQGRPGDDQGQTCVTGIPLARLFAVDQDNLRNLA